jgi:hypothetical protein
MDWRRGLLGVPPARRPPPACGAAEASVRTPRSGRLILVLSERPKPELFEDALSEIIRQAIATLLTPED